MHYAEILVDQRGFVVTAGVLSGPGRAYRFSAWIVLTLRGFCACTEFRSSISQDFHDKCWYPNIVELYTLGLHHIQVCKLY